MASTYFPSTREIGTFVENEIGQLGGRTTSLVSDEQSLFLRSVLPQVREVRPADEFQTGIAVAVVDQQIDVHPYLFRQICSNGAILAQPQKSHIYRRATMNFSAAVDEVYDEISAAVQACCAQDGFEAAFARIRSALKKKADHVTQLIPRLSRLGLANTESLRLILARFEQDGDPSVYGLMNAVTAVARTVETPITRWRLEELGGQLAVLVPPKPVGTPGASLVARGQ